MASNTTSHSNLESQANKIFIILWCCAIKKQHQNLLHHWKRKYMGNIHPPLTASDQSGTIHFYSQFISQDFLHNSNLTAREKVSGSWVFRLRLGLISTDTWFSDTGVWAGITPLAFLGLQLVGGRLWDFLASIVPWTKINPSQ